MNYTGLHERPPTVACAQTSSQSITDDNKSRDGEGGVGVGLTAGADTVFRKITFQTAKQLRIVPNGMLSMHRFDFYSFYDYFFLLWHKVKI